MGAIRKVDRPVFYPGRTVWGSTGECVDVGECVPSTDALAGVRVYLSERESREVLHAWGWPTPEKYAELKAAATDLQDEVEKLRAMLEEFRGQKTVAEIVAEELARQRKTATPTKTKKVGA